MKGEKNVCPFFIDGSYDQLGPVYNRTRFGFHCDLLDGVIYIPNCTHIDGPRNFEACSRYQKEKGNRK